MERKKKPFKLNMTYYVLIAFSLIQIIFGLTQDTPKEIILGLQSILSNPDTLVSDYIGVGGIGASFVNSGLLTLMFLFMLYKMKHRAHGVTIAGILTISGFALFGKNLLNVWFVVFGVYTRDRKLSEFKNIFKYSGRLITDYVKLEGLPFTLINMGLAGLLSLAYILIIGGDLNGPTIGGIYTIVGFAAFGKTPKTILPIFLGVSIGALTKTWGINEPAIQLAALFGTALAPIAGEFGSIYGILAAFVHSSVVLNVGFLHGGMNLYNNGFAAGIVAGFLLPIFEAFRKDED